MGTGIFIAIAAIWFLFLSERAWVKILCSAYLLLLLVLCVIDISQGADFKIWLLTFGAIVVVGLMAESVHRRWGNWP